MITSHHHHTRTVTAYRIYHATKITPAYRFIAFLSHQEFTWLLPAYLYNRGVKVSLSKSSFSSLPEYLKVFQNILFPGPLVYLNIWTNINDATIEDIYIVVVPMLSALHVLLNKLVYCVCIIIEGAACTRSQVFTTCVSKASANYYAN